ncbi:Urease subunit alpha, partial [Clarias magur]
MSFSVLTNGGRIFGPFGPMEKTNAVFSCRGLGRDLASGPSSSRISSSSPLVSSGSSERGLSGVCPDILLGVFPFPEEAPSREGGHAFVGTGET